MKKTQVKGINPTGKNLDYSLTRKQIAILVEREKNHINGSNKSYKLSSLKKALKATITK